VIAFDVSWRHGKAALARALNANLPPDVAIRELEGAQRGFHPRFNARRRTYQYTINNQIDPSPLLRRTTWHQRQPLDLTVMNQASKLLVGEHDFATFGQPPVGENTIRHLFRAEWQQEDALLSFLVEANAFLYRMVRSLVGSLCLVGRGEWSVGTFEKTFTAADRAMAGPTAPPQGLVLLSVTY
jgi:tRNA pseudouridine38-40 synthase